MVAATHQILRRWHLNNPAKVYPTRRRIFQIPVTFGGGNPARGFQITVTIETGICMFLIVLLQTEARLYLKASFPLNAMSKKSFLTLILLNFSIHSHGPFLLVFQVCFVALFIYSLSFSIITCVGVGQQTSF
jgi:hypothetical protein